MKILWIIPLMILLSRSTLISSQSTGSNLIGSNCNATEDCVSNSICLYKICQCQPGFEVLASLQCRVDFDGKCSKESDCNTAMGLHCIDSVCKCVDQEYQYDLGSCMSSSMKNMYEDIVALINQTELELNRFSTLLNIFMISSQNGGEVNSDQNNFQVDNIPAAATPIEIDPIVYHRLENLERALLADAQQNQIPITSATEQNEMPVPVVKEVAEQNSIPMAATTAEKTDTPIPLASPGDSDNVHIPIVEVGTQQHTTPLTAAAPIQTQIPIAMSEDSTTASSRVEAVTMSSLSGQEVRAQQEVPPQTFAIPNNSLNITSVNAGDANLPNSLNQLLNTPQVGGGVPGGNIAPPPNPFQFPPPPGGNLNDTTNTLTSVLPTFVSMFSQILPFIQAFNNVLSSSLLQAQGALQQGAQGLTNAPNGTNPAGAVPSPGGPPGGLNVNNLQGAFNIGGPINAGGSGGGLGGLLQIPSRILMIPGQIFNTFFGENSQLSQLKQRFIPVDFSNRPIRVLPWPIG